MVIKRVIRHGSEESQVKMIRKLIKTLPVVRFLINTDTYKHFRHHVTLHSSERQNATFTLFLRLPTQFDALSGPVVDFLLSHGDADKLKITILGCSNGAEAFSVASILKDRHPDLKFSIHGYDIVKEIIDKANNACYTGEEVFSNKMVTPSFANHTFDVENGYYKIKPEIARLVHFSLADALDPNLRNIIGASDIVFAQNFLFHMEPKIANKAFNNICSLLAHRAALFIDGMDLGMRQKLTYINHLSPLNYKIEEIHNEARVGRTDAWPFVYWGIEPFLTVRKEWQRRYSTIFIKS